MVAVFQFISAGTLLTLIVTIIGVAMYIQKLRSDIDGVKTESCQKYNHLNERFEDYKEVNSGVFKEIKDSLNKLNDMVMELLKQRRQEDK